MFNNHNQTDSDCRGVWTYFCRADAWCSFIHSLLLVSQGSSDKYEETSDHVLELSIINLRRVDTERSKRLTNRNADRTDAHKSINTPDDVLLVDRPQYLRIFGLKFVFCGKLMSECFESASFDAGG